MGYHVSINVTTTFSVMHNYASPHGGIRKIWRELVVHEPEFAQRWYREILALHVQGSLVEKHLQWVNTSNVVQHVQREHVELLKEGICDWNLETTCWKQGLALNDLKYAEAYVLDLEKNGESIYVEMNDNEDNEDNEEKNTSLTELQYKVSFCSIVLLDPNDQIFLVRHRTGFLTPPGGKIDREVDTNSLDGAKREFEEETGVSFDTLTANGCVQSIGVYVFFHPEASAKGKHTITFSFCFRLTQTFTIETLFNLDTVQTGETMACFVPLKEIAVMPVRACPLASLRASFYDYFDDKEHDIMKNKVMKWHQDRNSVLVGNAMQVAGDRSRWIK